MLTYFLYLGIITIFTYELKPFFQFCSKSFFLCYY